MRPRVDVVPNAMYIHVLTFSSLIYRTHLSWTNTQEWKDLITVVVRKWLSQDYMYQACITIRPSQA